MTRRAIGLLRRLGLVAASLATLWAGMTLVWALVRPGVVEQVGTGSLVGVVALLAAPGLALAALTLDARIARVCRRERGRPGGQGEVWSGRAGVVAHRASAPREPRQSRRVRTTAPTDVPIETRIDAVLGTITAD